MKSINEYLLSKANHKVSSEIFNLKMSPDDISKILYGYDVKELPIGEYYENEPQENEILIMNKNNAFGGKDIKFNIKSKIYTFSFNDKKLTYINIKDGDNIYSALNDKQIEKTLEEINEYIV